MFFLHVPPTVFEINSCPCTVESGSSFIQNAFPTVPIELMEFLEGCLLSRLEGLTLSPLFKKVNLEHFGFFVLLISFFLEPILCVLFPFCLYFFA